MKTDFYRFLSSFGWCGTTWAMGIYIMSEGNSTSFIGENWVVETPVTMNDKWDDMPGRGAAAIITKDSPREADVGRALAAREALAPEAACNVKGGNWREGFFFRLVGVARRQTLSPSWMHQAGQRCPLRPFNPSNPVASEKLFCPQPISNKSDLWSDPDPAACLLWQVMSRQSVRLQRPDAQLAQLAAAAQSKLFLDTQLFTSSHSPDLLRIVVECNWIGEVLWKPQITSFHQSLLSVCLLLCLFVCQIRR